MLKPPSEQQKYLITYSPVQGADNELAVNSRSMLQILMALAMPVVCPMQEATEDKQLQR